jgi:AraC family L-rhamnose operon regulatory protein RhaS
MKPQTFAQRHDIGRIVPIQCVKGDALKDLDIKDSCLLLAIIYEGSARFQVGDVSFDAVGPCFVCFDETTSPRLVEKSGLRCDSIYFAPTFLNVNITFERIHRWDYKEIALTHDMFLLKPFTDKDRYVFPIFIEHIDNIERLFSQLEGELKNQTDWYWSCRSRSYFMEMMLVLERNYGLIEPNDADGTAKKIVNPHLKKAVVYIENNYQNAVTLESIVRAASLNHSTLTALFKEELGMTPIEYLWHHRLVVAKKFLEFTNLPIKDVAARCGFKTTQHFSRKFEETVGANPSVFRSAAVASRKKAF